ncbi:MAG: hypothetical protein DDT40_01693 [candidate division WS2 bacterium]|nr:hypothetical protein [Candidatus Psychracetigena formicireducens]
MNVLRRAPKIILIGLDGLMPDMLEKFISEGILPNFKKIMDNGVYSHCLPVPSTVTPTNWVSIATGAYSGTHGVDGFAKHMKGESFKKAKRYTQIMFPEYPKDPLMKNDHSKAEYFWDTAEKSGKRCLIVNYPSGWPPSIRDGIVIDGNWGFIASFANSPQLIIYK